LGGVKQMCPLTEHSATWPASGFTLAAVAVQFCISSNSSCVTASITQQACSGHAAVVAAAAVKCCCDNKTILLLRLLCRCMRIS
jgi:hypothetical protein